MGSAIAFWVAVGITSAICYALMTRAENAGRRRAGAGRSGGVDNGTGYSGTSDGYWLRSWFYSENISSSVDSSGDPIDSGSCSIDSGSSDGGGDCGGGSSSSD